MRFFARVWSFLFDTSSAQKNRREVKDILAATLILSASDADFPRTLRQVLVEWEGGPEMGRARYHTFLRFMAQHRRRSDRPDDWHRRARHLIEDLPCIYGERAGN